MSEQSVVERSVRALTAAILDDREEALDALEALAPEETTAGRDVFAACVGWVEAARRYGEMKEPSPGFWKLEIESRDGQPIPDNSDEVWVGRFYTAGLNRDTETQWALFLATDAQEQAIRRVWLLLLLVGLVIRERATRKREPA